MPPNELRTPTSCDYDADYYERGKETGKSCYKDYRWLPELTIPMAASICDHAGISRGASVLDFGCAKGFVVKALRMLGRNARGADVSNYAIRQAPDDIRGCLQLLTPGIPLVNQLMPYEFIIAKDVLEHIAEDDISPVCEALARRCRHLFVVVPVGENGRYVIPEYELDVTHKIRRPPSWWGQRFDGLFTEVDVMDHVDGVKDNWYKIDPRGNAVIKCNFSRV